MDVVSVAAQLCAVPPANFISARSDAVRSARAEGDDELATTIGALRKPSVAAWAVNLLAGDQSVEFTELLDAGRELRTARADLDTARLQTWSATRRRLLPWLMARAAELVAEHGARLSAPALDDVATTLESAVTDAGAAAAVASGRLLRPLRASGLEPIDLAGALAGPPPESVPSRARPVLRSIAGTGTGADEPGPIRRRESAARVQARDNARERAALAERAVLKADNTRTRLSVEADRLAAQVVDAEAVLAELQQAHERAVAARAKAERELAAAREARSNARAKLAEFAGD